MIPELGTLSLVIALVFALLLSIIPTLGLYNKRIDWMDSARHYVFAQAFFIVLAYICLTISFLNNDFSVQYVLSNSSINLPWFYKICAVWGGHEGSMLLWIAILNFWMVMVACFSQTLELEMRTRVLVVLGILSIGFILFLVSTSNPFTRQFIALDVQGRDLNPLLQDPGFLFHPPMLYMGYSGFSVAFAFAIAALWQGKMDASFSYFVRPWTLVSWSCLTAGITLGSWWAYRELGWGGWWFWDPVENASFMPWLVGTALIHSLIVTERRGQFKAWTLLLGIMAFSLSLIGTFLVRSGVLTSVHAFAVDPERGLYILCFLMIVIGGSLLLFAVRANQLKNDSQSGLLSRESMLLLNNVFLVVIMLSVLLGTLYPLLIDSLHLGKLSVGAPYFNAVFIPLMIPVLLLMGIGVQVRWQQDSWKALFQRLWKVFLLSGLVAFILMWNVFSRIQLQVYFGFILAFWVIFGTVKVLYNRIQQRGIHRIGPGFWGMVIAHCGIALTVIGISVSSGYGIQKDVQMAPGDSIYLAGHYIQFIKTSALTGPNYHGTQTVFSVTRGSNTRMIYPEKRIYDAGQMAMTESAIDVTPFRDIYVALGEPIGEKSWSVRLYYKPMIRGIWGGGFLMLMGGCLAFGERRYQRKRMVQNNLEVLI